MAIARGVLTAGLLWVCLFATARGEVSTSRCLACHAAHYTQQGSCTSCHRGDAEAIRPALAHNKLLTGGAAAWRLPESPVLARAKILRDNLACRRCHQTGGQGENLATDLDAVVRKRSQEQLRIALLQPASAMPHFGLTITQADTLIALLLHNGREPNNEEHYRVHFRGAPSDTVPTFTRLCGSCHRALGRYGPLGSGSNGPDLSGLMGPFHPLDHDQPWTQERLSQWLTNPRSLRPGTTMPPVRLKKGELQAILHEISTPPVR